MPDPERRQNVRPTLRVLKTLPEITVDDPCPRCGGGLTWCDCGQGFPLEHLICIGCGEDVTECDCEPHQDWRCECGDLNRWHESFCYRCGAGRPE